MKISTKCKFCGCDIEAEADDECPKEWTDILVLMLCCNRCGDYREWKRRILTTAKKACWDWAVKTPEAKERDIQKTFSLLEKLTKNIVFVMARFHRAQLHWSRNFVEELMENPHKAEFIINSFENSCRRASGEVGKVQLKELLGMQV